MRTAPLLALALLLGACTHSRTVVGDGSRDALNREAAGRTVRVALVDGRRAAASSLRADADSVSWIDPATGALEAAAVADVRSVTVGGRRGRGLLEGLLLGTATGALSGGLLGFATYDDGSGSPGCFFVCSRGEAAGFLGTLGGMAGAVVGSGVGLVRGSPTAYALPPALSPVAPPPAVAGPPAREAP